MSHASVVLTECPNCGAAMNGAYCAACGQKAAPINPTLADFFHDFTHELLHVDGRIFRSAQLLLTKPGYLTHEYFHGRRARYVTPIRLYLIFSLIYFAAAAIAPKTSDEGVRVRATRTDDEELRQREFESAGALQRAADTAIDTWAPRAMFVLVPLFALLVKGVTRDSGRNYPQHLYFALHVHAAAFAFMTVGVLARYARAIPYFTDIVGLVVAVTVGAYGVLALRRAYGGTTARALRRAAVVGMLYFFAVALTIAAIILPIIRRLMT